MEEQRFACIEKIKTTGSTYMAAAGLKGGNESDNNHVVAIAEFVFAIKKQLQYVNEHSWNNFKLRIGRCQRKVLNDECECHKFLHVVGTYVVL